MIFFKVETLWKLGLTSTNYEYILCKTIHLLNYELQKCDDCDYIAYNLGLQKINKKRSRLNCRGFSDNKLSRLLFTLKNVNGHVHC